MTTTIPPAAAAGKALVPLEIARHLGEFSSEAVIATDTSGILLYCNKHTTELFGWTDDELLGQSIELMIPDRFRRSHNASFHAFASGAESSRHLDQPQLRAVRSDGNEFPAEITVSRIVDGDTSVLFATLRDVTNRLLAEETIRASERRLKNIFEGAAVALWEEDFSEVARWLGNLQDAGVEDLRSYLESHPGDVEYLAGLIKIVSVNPAGLALVGSGRDDSDHSGIAPSWITDSVRRSLVTQFEAIWNGTDHVEFDMTGADPAGNPKDVIVHWSAPCIDGERDLEAVVVSMVDISERVLAEQQLEEIEEHLQRAQKLEAIGQLAAGVAHEINTPIQYVNDNAGFLKDAFVSLGTLVGAATAVVAAAEKGDISPDLIEAAQAAAKTADYEYLAEEVPDAFEELLDGIQRVAKIVAALKKFSHPGRAEKSPEDINKIVEDSLAVSRNEWKYNATVILELDDEMPLVNCMAAEMGQVVLNIVINAAHAIAENEPGAMGEITIRTGVDDDTAFIEIADTGPGIPDEIKERVFEPFFTTKDVGQGTGQGLALAHKIVVDQHQGRLNLKTELGVGTIFTVELPAKPGATTPAIDQESSDTHRTSEIDE